MEIPAAVQDRLQYLLDTMGGEISYLGDYQGEEAYLFCFPEGMTVGFPVVVLYQKETEQVHEVSGYKALDIIGGKME